MKSPYLISIHIIAITLYDYFTGYVKLFLFLKCDSTTGANGFFFFNLLPNFCYWCSWRHLPTMRRSSSSTSRCSRRRSSAASWSHRSGSTNCARSSSKRYRTTSYRWFCPSLCVFNKNSVHPPWPVIPVNLCNDALNEAKQHLCLHLCGRSWVRTSPLQRKRSRSGYPSRKRTSSTSRSGCLCQYVHKQNQVMILCKHSNKCMYSLQSVTLTKLSLSGTNQDRPFLASEISVHKLNLLSLLLDSVWGMQ